jgi:hypothetical protein
MTNEEKKAEEFVYWYHWLLQQTPGPEIEVLFPRTEMMGGIIINLN